jgi:hypothetical protein
MAKLDANSTISQPCKNSRSSVNSRADRPLPDDWNATLPFRVTSKTQTYLERQLLVLPSPLSQFDIIGHGVEGDGRVYCCANCAGQAAVPAVADRAA